ncbi:MAG: hypothetical protein R6V15_13770 [Desulfotignum sp.]
MKLVPKGLTPGNLAIGAGVVLLAPVVIPVIGSIAKPIAKSIIKGALISYKAGGWPHDRSTSAPASRARRR